MNRAAHKAARVLCAGLLLPVLALAQTAVCPGTSPPTFYTDFLSGGAYICAPGPFGAGTVPTIEFNAAGTTAWWYCPNPDGSWTVEWSAGTKATLTPAYLATLASSLAGVLASSTPVTALNSLAVSNASKPLSDPSMTPVWCPWWAAMYNGAPPHGPSADGTLVPTTSTIYDAAGAAWTLLANGFVALNGAQTNGHGVEILYIKGSVYVLSPTGGFWWKWMGSNTWQRLTTTQPTS